MGRHLRATRRVQHLSWHNNIDRYRVRRRAAPVLIGPGEPADVVGAHGSLRATAQLRIQCRARHVNKQGCVPTGAAPLRCVSTRRGRACPGAFNRRGAGRVPAGQVVMK